MVTRLNTPTKKNRKEEILEAAAELFKEKGYAATTVRDIGDRVGIEAASLYNHIKSKDEVLNEICFEVGHEFIREMRRIASMNNSPVDQLTALIHLHIDMTTTKAAMISVANEEWRHLRAPYLDEFIEMRTNYENCFLQILDTGIESGDFRQADSTIMLYTILSSVRWLQHWYRDDRPISVEEIRNEISELIIKGLTT